jgi:hypothetical protein
MTTAVDCEPQTDVEIGSIVACGEEEAKEWIRTRKRWSSDDNVFNRLVMPLLGTDKVYDTKVMTDIKTGERTYNVYFEKDGVVKRIYVRIDSNPYFSLENLAEQSEFNAAMDCGDIVMNIIKDGRRDEMFVNPETGKVFIKRIEVQPQKPGYVAEGIYKYVTRFFDFEGNSKDSKSMIKANKSQEITKREVAMLRGIRTDQELARLGVYVPELYGSLNEAVCIERLDFPTLETLIQEGKLPKEKAKRLVQRVFQATQRIERNTQRYLEASGEKIGSQNKPNSHKKTLNEHFDSQEHTSTASSLGSSHSKAVSYLESRGMFDIWLSDSRLGNWLYDEKTDKLYKVDENIALRGSRFGCLARIADFDHTITGKERDEMLASMKPESLEDAYLSLYITNIESAQGFQKRIEEGKGDVKTVELLKKRIETARDYLDRLSQISAKYESLREELEKIRGCCLSEDAYARAA